ncbi:CGNR zinc finger domain-containing protein [Microbacterium radiodurans]|uniref:CGNR zinc finger domain-containing protein n=1 Tax=Microbacterium radiodurans TaxID=661398 RepID=A0A5J5INV1_9MICO|nr:CGNR zinc finger domain-containing protein [Microbacterium radiodurans]KAA9085293.1 CGNR zinc finger domain-containing protein [Microbacterium radiodurans]
MQLNPYGEYAVLLAASLANDWPASRDEIVERTYAFGMTAVYAPAERNDHAATRAAIDDWLAVVDAGEPAERAALLNLQMARATAYPRLTDHDGAWHLHYRDSDQRLPQVLRAVIAVGTALHVTTRGMDRLRRCAAGEVPGDGCRSVVVDVTRNGRQRYCSVRCANRDGVRRHRARAAGRRPAL